MTVTITNKEFIFSDTSTGEYRAVQEGDDINFCYYHITLSTGYDFYIPGWADEMWNSDTVRNEIISAIAAAQRREDDANGVIQAAQILLDNL